MHYIQITQQINTFSKPTIETLEKGVKYVFKVFVKDTRAT